jgi:hypothetical protein
MGAVTTERTAVPGCRVYPVGVMRYLPVARRSYIDWALAAETPLFPLDGPSAALDALTREPLQESQ